MKVPASGATVAPEGRTVEAAARSGLEQGSAEACAIWMPEPNIAATTIMSRIGTATIAPITSVATAAQTITIVRLMGPRPALPALSQPALSSVPGTGPMRVTLAAARRR